MVRRPRYLAAVNFLNLNREGSSVGSAARKTIRSFMLATPHSTDSLLNIRIPYGRLTNRVKHNGRKINWRLLSAAGELNRLRILVDYPKPKK